MVVKKRRFLILQIHSYARNKHNNNGWDFPNPILLGTKRDIKEDKNKI